MNRFYFYLSASFYNLDTDTLTLSSAFLLSILKPNEIICFMHGEHTNSFIILRDIALQSWRNSIIAMEPLVQAIFSSYNPDLSNKS